MFKAILIILAYGAIASVSAWGFPYNLPTVIIGGIAAGLVAGRAKQSA